MPEIVTVGWNEDIDLVGGAAAIAAMKGQDHLRGLSGTDDIKVNNKDGVFLKRIRWVDEAGSGAGGYVGRSDKSRKYRYGKKVVVDNLAGELEFEGNNGGGEFIPQNTVLSCFGNVTGQAEQHVVLMDWIVPDIPAVETVPWGSWKREIWLGVKTGTLVAATVTGFTDIINNFEDSEQAFGEDPEAEFCLISVTPSPSGAGYGVLGVAHNNRIVHRLFPAKLGTANAKEYLITNNLGEPAPWKFTGKTAPLAVGSGVSTTSMEMLLRIGILKLPES